MGGRLEFKHGDGVAVLSQEGAGNVERGLRSAGPVPAQAEAVDPHHALGPAHGGKEGIAAPPGEVKSPMNKDRPGHWYARKGGLFLQRR